MAKRIPSIPSEWGDFITCILLHMLLPLLPLFIEAWLNKGKVTDTTYAITCSMYAIAIGLSSKSYPMLGLCFLISIVFSVVFGIVSVSGSQLSFVGNASIICIFAVFLIHVMERYNRHVVDCVPFWDFEGKSI